MSCPLNRANNMTRRLGDSGVSVWVVAVALRAATLNNRKRQTKTFISNWEERHESET